MPILLVGLNHRTAPIDLREKLSLSGCALQMALEEFHDHTQSEAVILSTCNRLEIYAEAGDSNSGWSAIADFIAGLQNIPGEELQPHLYFLENESAVQQLMQVAAGLDSMILGETEILGQVSQAFQDALSAGTTGPILSHLFSQAVHAGKRARSETAFTSGVW